MNELGKEVLKNKHDKQMQTNNWLQYCHTLDSVNLHNWKFVGVLWGQLTMNNEMRCGYPENCQL